MSAKEETSVRNMELSRSKYGYYYYWTWGKPKYGAKCMKCRCKFLFEDEEVYTEEYKCLDFNYIDCPDYGNKMVIPRLNKLIYK